ncbi:MAG: LytR C-terminal domain-containing protein [Candidatus Woesebacteria bacterium]|nr:LytR C-terminal domain-containing protein [Candidatus Woesebacteria bacterium]
MSKKMVVVEEVVEEVKTPVVESKPEPEMVVEEEKSSYLWIIIPTALLVGALVGGLITYFSGISKLPETNSSPSTVASISPEASATPEPKVEVDRSKILLQVLNGSGTSGFAGKAKTYLEGLGYKDVMAGNAVTSDFTDTVISVKDSKKELLEIIKTDLSKNYKVAEKTETLSASSKYDFVITLGSK